MLFLESFVFLCIWSKLLDEVGFRLLGVATEPKLFFCFISNFLFSLWIFLGINPRESYTDKESVTHSCLSLGCWSRYSHPGLLFLFSWVVDGYTVYSGVFMDRPRKILCVIYLTVIVKWSSPLHSVDWLGKKVMKKNNESALDNAA